MGLFDAPLEFADKMISKFGLTNNWYLLSETKIKDATNPTKIDRVEVLEIPIKIAISSWDIELIDNTTILNSDRKGYILYSDDIRDYVKADNFVVQYSGEVMINKYKIVTPTKPLEFKGQISAYLVNLRI